MSRVETDNSLYHGTPSPITPMSGGEFLQPAVWGHAKAATSSPLVQPSGLPRRTPRKSLIVVLPDDHVVAPEIIANRLLSNGSDEGTDVTVACAGEPRDLGFLQREVHGLQVLRAPAGTSREDLRELAIGHVPGDIVTLVSGVPIEN